jgi:hypothetical protein
MTEFLQRHASSVTGMLSGFDRVRFRGTLRMLAHTGGFASFLRIIGVPLRDFKEYALQTTARMTRATRELADAAGRPLRYLPSADVSKEQEARSIAERDRIQRGLICVISCVEPCFSYTLRPFGTPQLEGGMRRCLHWYYYFMHEQLGLMHARLQSWFPLTMHICINGRAWLARQMDRARIGYLKRDNCFTDLPNAEAAQRLMDGQLKTDWRTLLDGIARRVNPEHEQIFAKLPMDRYWSTDQSEWATDVMFKSCRALSALYPQLLRHGMQTLGSREVMRFLGRRVPGEGSPLPPGLNAQVVSDLVARPEGVRIKHRVNGNSVKMYDKQGSVLRVETTINDAHDIKVYRPKEGARKNAKKQWRPLRKGIADLHRRAQVSESANQRYLASMASASQTIPLHQLTDKVCRAVTFQGRRVRALNPLAEQDAALLRAVGQGEFLLNGFRNRDLRALLHPRPPAANPDPQTDKRLAAAVTRKLRLLRAHGMIRKVPKTHRYMLSENGRRTISALIAAHQADTQKLLAA